VLFATDALSGIFSKWKIANERVVFSVVYP